MFALDVFTPDQLSSENPPILSSYKHRLLAEGDSWFTVGTINPLKNFNVLYALEFPQQSCAVNCGYPGDTLRKMAQMSGDKSYKKLLKGRAARDWDGLLLSAGGNDLIAALKWQGDGLAASDRLLLYTHEWDPSVPIPQRYVSMAGWQRFSQYLAANLRIMVSIRDQGPSKGRPMFLHGYARMTPRPAGATGKGQAWVYGALVKYQIPQNDFIALAAHLIDLLGATLRTCAQDPVAFPNVHFFDSAQVPITPAALGSTGESGDWVNEIHLTRRGYRKIAKPWSSHISGLLP